MSEPIVALHTSHLKELIAKAMAEHGPSCDLNHIDVSGIQDMRELFDGSSFNGDISAWDVSGVEVFSGMFRGSLFQGNLSQWNTASAESMYAMFQDSLFNGDISKWNIEAVTHSASMFERSRFNGEISSWRPRNLIDANNMFYCARFNGNVSGWTLPRLRNATAMFDKSSFDQDISLWHLPHVDPDSAARVVPATYTHAPPHVGGDFTERREFYRKLFKERRGSVGLTAYLEDRPFNAVHLDFALHTPSKTPGISEEDAQWVKNVRAAGLALGLNDDALWAYALSSFKERGNDLPMLDVDFSAI